jgi:peptidoglycan/LPS O-acetylase OafA/YrhL
MIEPRQRSLAYRKDIDGLRALAVVPVCFFHAGLPWFPGGFVGVDVFFVISGYLMASLIGRDLSTGKFSLADFYDRRARRILPALFVMLLFSSIVAAFIVSPKLFREFGESLIATVLFGSNILFWRKTANYFDAPTDWNPLVHTWSLGVEEQFYILFPLLLIVLWRVRWWARMQLITIAAIASLALSICGTVIAPTATFYLLPTRAWELLLGAVLALLPMRAVPLEIARPRWFGSLLGIGGIGLIVWSLLRFDRTMAFPGASALAPCCGTAALLYAGREASNPAARILSSAPLPWIGKISYSLYLWHWPLLVFVDRYLSFGTLGIYSRIGVVVFSVLLAYVSWRWVEQPFRSHKEAWASLWSRRRIFGASCVGMFALCVAGVVVVAGKGWPTRFPGFEAISMQRQIASESTDEVSKLFDEANCFVLDASDWHGESCFLNRHPGADNALLWGDSFAAAYSYGFFHNDGLRLGVLQYTAGQCPPILGYHAASRPQCDAFDREMPSIAQRYHVSTVIMAANWAGYIRTRKLTYADIAATVATLQRSGLRVILIGQDPIFTFAYPDEYFFRKFRSTPQIDYYAPLNADPNLNAHIAEAARADVFFDPFLAFCRSADCIFKIGQLYVVADYGHWTHYGSSLAVARLLEAANR